MTWLALWLETLALMNAPADLPPPVVIFDQNNYYRRGEIHVRVDECFATALAHEFSHHIAVETGRLDGVPNELVKERLEEIAQDVEHRLSAYHPNCERGRNE